MRLFFNCHVSGSFKFKHRPIDMIRAANMSLIGIFLPGETAAIAQHLDGRKDRIECTETHTGRGCPLDDKFPSGSVSQRTFSSHRIYGNLDSGIVH